MNTRFWVISLSLLLVGCHKHQIALPYAPRTACESELVRKTEDLEVLRECSKSTRLSTCALVVQRYREIVDERQKKLESLPGYDVYQSGLEEPWEALTIQVRGDLLEAAALLSQSKKKLREAQKHFNSGACQLP